jgi:hypothetical protein
VLDVVRERKPPFSPDDVVKEFCATLKSYGIGRVVGDRYGGEWPRETFRKCGIDYRIADKTKSDLCPRPRIRVQLSGNSCASVHGFAPRQRT